MHVRETKGDSPVKHCNAIVPICHILLADRSRILKELLSLCNARKEGERKGRLEGRIVTSSSEDC